MPEIFPPGYVALIDWIKREAGLRFGLMSSETPDEQYNIILDELSHKLSVGETAVAIAISDYGHQQNAPAFIWRRSESERRNILETGRTHFNASGQWIRWRIGIRDTFTLSPKPVIRPKQISESERIARQADGQRRAGISLSDFSGLPADLTSRAKPSAISSGSATEQSGSKKRPAPHVQRRDVKRVLDQHAATLGAGEKPTEDQWKTIAKERLQYEPARAHVRGWLKLPQNQRLKRAQGDKVVTGKSAK